MTNPTATRNLVKTLVALLVLTLAGAASAATYYVDAVAGNDANNGTTTSTAWKTLAKVSNRLFSPGDSVLLKRGGVWRDPLYVWSSGTAASPITFDAYGTGELPIINGANVVSNWTASGTNLYAAAVTVAPETVIFNGVKGVKVASVAALKSANTWYWSNNILQVYATSTPSGVEACARQFLVGVFTQSYVIVKNLDIRYGSYPVLAHNSSHLVFENLVVHDSVGVAGIYVLAEDPGKAEYNTIRNCSVYNISGSSDSLASGNDGCGIYFYGAGASYNLATGCTVHDNGQEGIVVFGGSYNRVAANTVYRSGQSGIRVALETAVGNVVEDNVSYANCLRADDRYGIDLLRVGNDNLVRYNTVHDQYATLNDAAVAADATNSGQKYGTGGIRFDGGNWEGHDNMQSTGNKAYYNVVYNEDCGIESFNFSNVEMYNNTIYNCRQFGISVQSVFSVTCSNNVVRNNVLHTAGNALVHLYRMNNTVIDKNVYYPDSTRAFLWRTASQYCYSNFAGWQRNSGQDVNSSVADPKFVDAAQRVFAVQAGSPCVDRALNIGLKEDIAGDAVPQGAGVDAGAYEFVASDPAPTVTIASVAPSLTKTAPIPVTVTFSEPVTGFVATDLVVKNATVTGFTGSGAAYSFNLSPTAQGAVTVSIPAGAATDLTGHSSTASATLTRTYDNVQPTVTMSSTAASRTTAKPIVVAIKFSEAVAGFTASKLAVSNATVASFSGSGSSYSVSLTPKASSTVTVNIAAGAGLDAAGNSSKAATALSRYYSGT